ncbi:MAG: NADH-quinone oxidoreductase subunit L [Halobacteriales archaeon]|jgi:NADH-quinone oxidoreductase subunit L
MVTTERTTERRSTPVSVLGIVVAVAVLGGMAIQLSDADPTELYALLAIAAPFVGVVLLPVVAMGGDALRKWFAVAIGALTGVLTLAVLPEALTGEPLHYTYAWAQPVDVTFGLYLDGLGATLAAIAGVVGALVLLFSTRFMERESGLTRYYVLTLLFVGAMVGFGLTDSLIAVYVFWEVLGLCSFGLIAFWMTDPDSFRGGMKAFVVTRFGDIGLLAGIGLLYAATGTFSIQNIVEQAGAGLIEPQWMLTWAGALFILAAMGKSAQFPLQVWLPDAMEAPTTITALIHAACMVNAGIYLIARTLPIFDGMGWWLDAILVIGTASAFLAALMATYATDLKRALAYCTISQLGYMMAGLGIVGGLLPATFHLLSHSLFKALLFLGAGSVIYALGGTVHKHVDMRENAGVANFDQMPITNLTFLVGLLGLIGFPGFNGFWSKELILGAGRAGDTLEVVAFAVLAVTAVLTVVYSIRIYHFVFRGEPEKEVDESPSAMTVPLIVLAALTATSWLAIDQFSHALEASYPAGAEVHAYDLGGLVEHVATAETIALTVGILAVGYLAFRSRTSIYDAAPDAVPAILERRYGINGFYLRIADLYRDLCGVVRRTQTGDVNYNTVGVVLAFLIGIAVLLV